MRLFFTNGIFAALVSLPLVCVAATAQDFKAGDLVIQHPWTRATPAGAEVGGGYLTIVNRGTAPDRLTGGSFEASAAFQLHEMSMVGDVMKMRPLQSLEIPPGGSVTLGPSGKHIMFTGLKHALKKGQEVEGTLIFDHAGTVPVRFEVEAVGAKAPAKDDGAHAMPGMTME